MHNLTEDIQTLCLFLTGPDVLDFFFDNDGPDFWSCTLCAAKVDVIYSDFESGATHFFARKLEPCDFEHFPHKEECHVLRARRILAALGQ